MITQQLLDYIAGQTQAGKSRAEITAALQSQGWQQADIDNAFNNPTAVIPSPTGNPLPKAGKIFDESWTIYKSRFQTLIVISLLPFVTYVVLGFLAGLVSAASKASGASFQGPVLLLIILVAIAVILFVIYIAIWSTVAQLVAIRDQAEAIGWKEAYSRAKGKIGLFFSTALLAGLAIIGGFILFIIPGIIFALWFSFSTYVLVEEGIGNTAALKKSKSLAKGRLGTVFGKFFYIGIITFGLYILLAIILGVISAVTGIKSQYLSWVSNVFSLIWTPLTVVYGYQLYKHLKSSPV